MLHPNLCVYMVLLVDGLIFLYMCATSSSITLSVAALTVRIEAMKGHMATHRKDFSSRRGMEAMMSKRRSLLKVRSAWVEGGWRGE